MKPHLLILIFASLLSTSSLAVECTNWQSLHPEWLWCDDFENDNSLEANYFEVVRSNSDFGVTQEAFFDGQGSLKATFLPGIEQTGDIKFSLGRTPVAPTRYTNEDFDEVYWRIYVMHEPGWVGNPHKLARATIFSSSDWSQAAIGHLWNNGNLGLAIDPVSGVSGNTVITQGYNDFDNMIWLGNKSGQLEIFAPENVGKWQCIEVHMALNTPNQTDGILEFWIDGELQASTNNLNWRGGYTQYGINAIFIENYANGGMSREQSRYMDNFIVSRQRINCKSTTNGKAPPLPPNAVAVE